MEDELDQTNMLLKQKVLIIEQLEKETGEKAVEFHVEKATIIAKKQSGYRAL